MIMSRNKFNVILVIVCVVLSFLTGKGIIGHFSYVIYGFQDKLFMNPLPCAFENIIKK
jgi:hypothetical protein